MRSATFRRLRPARCWKPSRWSPRPASASRSTPRPRRSWRGARHAWRRRGGAIRSPISPRARPGARARRSPPPPSSPHAPARASPPPPPPAPAHAPHAPEEKPRNDMWSVDCGFPGVETQMPLMLTEVANGRFSICDYVRWSAANPAKVWGLYPRKGVIAPGADADIAVVDLGRAWTIDDANIQSRAKISPWHGRGVKGLPLHTIVRGRFVMRNRTLAADARGWGRSVHAIQHMKPAAVRHG